ncbi:MAG: hypothetical protein Q7R95_03470 [bacterium]|nr:hypothetical protein [bacterium]
MPIENRTLVQRSGDIAPNTEITQPQKLLFTHLFKLDETQQDKYAQQYVDFHKVSRRTMLSKIGNRIKDFFPFFVLFSKTNPLPHVNLPPLNRRKFVKLSALLAITGMVLASCAPTPNLSPIILPNTPTPKPEPIVPAIKDEEFPSNTKERTAKLLGGAFPESWYKLSDNVLLDKLRTEVKSSVINEYITALGGKDADKKKVLDNIFFGRTYDDVAKLIMEKMQKTEEKAKKDVEDYSGKTFVTVSDDPTNYYSAKIVISEESILNETKKTINQLITSSPNNKDLYNTRAFFTYLLMKNYIETVIHETTHAAKQSGKIYTLEESNMLKQQFQDTLVTNGKAIFPDSFHYSIGMATYVKVNSAEIPFYVELNEAFRTYVETAAVNKITHPDQQDIGSNIYDKRENYDLDVVRCLFIYALNKELGITAQEFLRDSPKIETQAILNFYVIKAKEKNIGLNAPNFANIFSFIDSSIRVHQGQTPQQIDYQFVQNNMNSIQNLINILKGQSPLPISTLPASKPAPSAKATIAPVPAPAPKPNK